ncbi:hypothetical protein TNCV_1263601 [Trichonephila clavipes]|nr:hypothetical protein TNCV_1263601 [Trichonephila clavipes]
MAVLVTEALPTEALYTYQANSYSESTRGFARGPSIRDKDAECYQGQNPKNGIRTIRYTDVRVPLPQMATRESDVEWYRIPRGGTRNKPNFTKTHEPGGNSGDHDRTGGDEEGAIRCFR